LVVISAVPLQRSHANAVFKETYLILNGGPQAGDYYYEGLDAGGGNVTINSINGSINLLSGSLTLKGGEVKTTMSGGDYQNGNNWMKMYYRFYDQTETVPGWSEQSVAFVQENPYPENLFRTSNASSNLLTGNDSGVYKLDVYWNGNASYFSGGQQFFDMNQTTTYTATFTLFYGATTTATQGSAFTGTGYFNFNGSGQTYTLSSGSNSYTGETQIQAGTVALSGSGTVASSSVVKIAASSTFDISAVTASSTTVKGVSEYGNNNGGSVKLGSKKLVINGGSGTQYLNVLGISGDTGSFELNDSDTTLSLYGNSLYTGATTLTAGTLTTSGTMASTSFTLSGGNLTITADDRLDNSASVAVNSGTFTANGSDTIGLLSGTGGTVSIGSGKSLTTTTTGSVSYSGVITGSGNLVKEGVGTLTLDGSSANNFSGTTTVKNGVLILAKTGGVNGLAGTPTINTGATIKLAAGNQFNGDSTFLTIDSGGTFDLNGFNETLAIQGGGTIILGAGTITINPTLTDTFSGSISGSGGVTKANSGTQVLSGSSSYTGVTTVSGGSLEVRHASALGASGAGQGTTVSSGAVLTYSNATSMSVAEGLTLNGTGVSGIGGALKNVSGSNTQTGAITLGSSARIAATGGSLALEGNIGGGSNVLYLGTDGGSISISSIINGAGATQDGTTTSIFKDGSGTLTLTGANTFTGDTRISAGKITVGSGGSLGSGSDVFLANAGTLEVNANTAVASVQEWAGSNSGVIAIGTGATLTIDGANKGTLYQNSISGLGGLTMAGSGTTSLSLFGTQSYSGLTSVSGGKISTGVVLSNSSGVAVSGGTFETSAVNILKDTATVTISGTGAYSLGGNDTVASLTMTGGTLSGAGTMTATSAFNIQAGTISAGLGGSVGLNKTGSGTATLSGSSSYSGKTTISAGILEVTSSNALGNGGAGNGVDIASGARLRATANMTNARAITITSGTGFVEASSGTTNTMSGTLTKDGTTLVLGGGGTHIVNGSIVGASANSDLVVSNSTTTINTANSYNGPTLIVAAGTLNNGINNALPTDTALTLGQSGETSSTTNRYNLNGYSQTVASVATAGSSVNIVTNSTGTGNLTLNSSSAKSISNLTMGGTGLTLTKSGANTVTLASGNNIGPGTIAIQQGTLLLGAANQIGDSTAINLSGGILSTAGYADAAGKLTVSANSTIQGLNSTSGAAFTFSDVDLSNYSTSSGSTLTFVNSAGGNYSLGTVFQISTVAANSWTGYSETSLNNFSQKIQFGNGNVGQISFGSGISGTTLTVAAIPDARVYSAAVALIFLIGIAEVRRRRNKTARPV
jgi:autotransporter-associated beta strand protein